MQVVIILGGLLLVLFVMAFITKRRLGVLGFALAAGAILSGLWTDKVTASVEGLGLQIAAPPLSLLVAIALLLLPALLLLMSGPTYTKKGHRIVGAAVFAFLACAFLVEPLGRNIVLTPETQDVYTFIATNNTYIITLGLIASLADLLVTKTHKPPKEGKH